MVECSTEDRLCLSLLAGESEPGTASTPAVLETLGVRERAVTSHFEVISGLSTLEKRGFIEARRQADGENQTVYELTEAGREHARAIERRLSDRTVTVETGGVQEEMTLAGVAEQFDRSLAEVAATAENGVLVLDDLEEAVEPEAMPFVGRDRELSELEAHLDRAGTGQQGPVCIEGTPGVGKTALVTAFCDRVDSQGGTALYGQCARETETPYGPVLSAIRDLPSGEDDGIARLLTATDTGPGEPPDLERRRQSLFASVAEELGAVAADRPIVLAVDDTQWVDRPTALLVAYLARALADEPFLAVAASYPPEAAGGHPIHEALEQHDCPDPPRLTLGPFDVAATSELVCRLAGTRRVPDAFVETVHDHTGGNPLFLTESVTRMIEEGVVQPAAGTYPEAAADLLVPETVEASIRTRLDGLDDRTRRVLEVASLIGTVVPEQVLVEACDSPEVVVRNRTELLVGSRLWDREDEETLRFVSDVVRETVRDTVPEDRRTDCHRRIAGVYETREMRPEARAAAAASHYQRAGAPEQAIRASLTAADHATDVYAHEVAIGACERAVELAREVGDESTVAEALELLGDTDRVIGDYEEATRCYQYVRERTDTRETVQRTHRKEGAVVLKTGEVSGAMDHIDRALEIAEDRNDRQGELRIRNRLGQVEKKQGNFEAAREQFERALEIAREIASLRGEARSLNHIGQVADKQGYLDDAREYYDRSLDRFRELGDRWEQGKILGNIGIIAEKKGDYGTAREYHQRSLDVDRELGDKRRQAIALNNLGTVERETGNLSKAREYHQDALDRYRYLGDRHGQSLCLGNLGAVAQSNRDLERAREYFRRSLELKRSIGDRHGEAKSLGNLGLVAEDEGRFDTAQESLEQCLDILQDLGDRYGEARARQFLGSIRSGMGEFDRARDSLRRALALERELGNQHGEARSVDLLGEIDRAQGKHEAARGRHREALEQFRELGDPVGEAGSLLSLGLVALEADGDADEEWFRAAIELFEQLDDPVGEHRCRALLGAAEIDRGETGEGREKLDRALAELRPTGMVPVELEVLRHHAGVELARGNVARVEDICARARDRVAATDAGLGYERARLESLCDRVDG